MGSPLERFDHSPFEYNSRLFTNHEPRLFLGLRCGVPPRQTQTNNDASGNPQRVAGRPPFLFVRVTALHLTGQRLWASPTESHTGDGNECRPQKKYTANGLVRGGRPESLFGPSGADQRKAQGGCQNGQLWLASRCEIWPYLFLYDARFLRATNDEPLFFHEPRAIRGNVVNLSLLSQSGI